MCRKQAHAHVQPWLTSFHRSWKPPGFSHCLLINQLTLLLIKEYCYILNGKVGTKPFEIIGLPHGPAHKILKTVLHILDGQKLSVEKACGMVLVLQLGHNQELRRNWHRLTWACCQPSASHISRTARHLQMVRQLAVTADVSLLHYCGAPKLYH